ncbi:MAG: hypothetical protein B7Y25_08610 [Alphaproteobacteria bacterium 16-39-46]|nr:MAG: hypothetical protein B7Y25_08610 [Alphaproteobacteria bacterium 16-39-46]OZA40972.1 MAG: hypothetical protein B7X84_08740 [Alphaproteobacteria bacterium 17-39-52]
MLNGPNIIMDKNILEKWLTAGYIDKNVFYPTKIGTPQGGLCKALHNPPYAKKVIMQIDHKNYSVFQNSIRIYFA